MTIEREIAEDLDRFAYFESLINPSGLVTSKILLRFQKAANFCQLVQSVAQERCSSVY